MKRRFTSLSQITGKEKLIMISLVNLNMKLMVKKLKIMQGEKNKKARNQKIILKRKKS